MDRHGARSQAGDRQEVYIAIYKFALDGIRHHACSQHIAPISFDEDVTFVGSRRVGISHVKFCAKFAPHFQTARKNSTVRYMAIS